MYITALSFLWEIIFGRQARLKQNKYETTDVNIKASNLSWLSCQSENRDKFHNGSKINRIAF